MDIKFVELGPKEVDEKDYRWCLFNVGGKSIRIGINGTLRTIWKIEGDENALLSFFKEFGTQAIKWMVAENNLGDYTFEDFNFFVNGKEISIEKLGEYLRNKIDEAEEKNKQIGFKY